MRLVAPVALVAAACGSCSSSANVPPPAPAPAAPAAVAVPAASSPWETPAGWKTETIPFPLEFAPGLPYRGVEELRFPPGFFDKDAAWYFSYAFVWEIVAPGPASADALEGDLVAYFEGLAKAVGGAEQAEAISAQRFTAALEGELATGASGVIEAFDAFKARAPVTLHARATAVACATAGRVALVVVASPRTPSTDDAVWTELERLAATYRCR